MPAFEYRIVIGSEDDEEDETMLNELGAEGWELVSVRISEVPVGFGDEDDEDEEGDEEEDLIEDGYLAEVATYYLKRVKTA